MKLQGWSELSWLRAKVAAAVSLSGILLAGVGPTDATILVYEPFDYDAETVLDGTAATGQNLTGTYAPLGTAPQQKLLVTSPGLSYGSLTGAPTAPGNRIGDTAGVTAAVAR